MTTKSLLCTFTEDPACPLCNIGPDSLIHLFGHCPSIIRIPWRRSEWCIFNCAPQNWNGDLKTLIDFLLRVAKDSLDLLEWLPALLIIYGRAFQLSVERKE